MGGNLWESGQRGGNWIHHQIPFLFSFKNSDFVWRAPFGQLGAEYNKREGVQDFWNLLSQSEKGCNFPGQSV